MQWPIACGYGVTAMVDSLTCSMQLFIQNAPLARLSSRRTSSQKTCQFPALKKPVEPTLRAICDSAYKSTIAVRIRLFGAGTRSGWIPDSGQIQARFRQWSIEQEIGTIRCPLLAVQGLNDPFGTMQQIRGIARQLPQTEILETPDCGHSPQRKQPAQLMAAAARFIQNVNQAPNLTGEVAVDAGKFAIGARDGT